MQHPLNNIVIPNNNIQEHIIFIRSNNNSIQDKLSRHLQTLRHNRKCIPLTNIKRKTIRKSHNKNTQKKKKNKKKKKYKKSLKK